MKLWYLLHGSSSLIFFPPVNHPTWAGNVILFLRIESVPVKKLHSFSSYSSPSLSIQSKLNVNVIVRFRRFVARCRAIPKLVYSVQSIRKYNTRSSLELRFLFRLLQMVITRRGNNTGKSRNVICEQV